MTDSVLSSLFVLFVSEAPALTVVFNSIDDFNLETLERVAVRAERARFGAEAVAVMSAAHEAFTHYILANPDAFVYGVTSDFGPHARNRVDPDTRMQRLSRGAPFLGLSFGEELQALQGRFAAAAISGDALKRA